jgi:hypothetical protein
MQRRTVLLGTIGLMSAAYSGTIATGALRPCAHFEIDNPLLASAIRIGERLMASGFEAAPLVDDRLDWLVADLPERTRRDFATNETVKYDGWFLSRSEAEFCIHCATLSVKVA